MPRWRLFLSTLNWRRDPDYEQRMMQYEQGKLQHEQRMKQLEERTRQIEKETEQLRRENAREQALSDSIRRLCFPPGCNSTLPSSTEPDCRPSSP